MTVRTIPFELRNPVSRILEMAFAKNDFANPSRDAPESIMYVTSRVGMPSASLGARVFVSATISSANRLAMPQIVGA